MDDQELEKMVLETWRMTKENREYLKKIDSRQKWSRNVTAFYWLIAAILILVAYYFVAPYFQTIKDTVTGVTQTVGGFVDLAKPAK